MGWKLSLLVIKDYEVDNIESLFEKLGYKGLKKADDLVFSQCMNPIEDRLYFSIYNGNTIIAAPDLPNILIDYKNSESHNILFNLFPDQEICCLLLHSVVDLWGIGIFKNGQIIRQKAGCADEGVFVDNGLPIPEEKIVHENLSPEEIIEYELVEGEIENFVGEELVFLVAKRYFGEILDYAPDELFDQVFSGYLFGTDFNNKNLPMKENKIAKPWWKFW